MQLIAAAEGRAARPVRRRRRLPRLRRQPRHRDHDPERRPQGRPGARPHRRRDRRRIRPGARVRGDRAQGGRPPPGDRAGGRRPGPSRGPRPTTPRSAVGRRDRAGPGSPAVILVIDNYDSFTFNLVQALAGRRRGRPRRAQRRDRRRRRSASWPTTRARTCAGSSSRPDRAIRTTPASRSRRVRVAAERGIPLLGVCLGMQSMAAAFGASIVRAPTLVHGEASEVTHDGAGLLDGHAARRSWPPATTRWRSTRRPCRPSCGSPP